MQMIFIAIRGFTTACFIFVIALYAYMHYFYSYNVYMVPTFALVAFLLIFLSYPIGLLYIILLEIIINYTFLKFLEDSEVFKILESIILIFLFWYQWYVWMPKLMRDKKWKFFYVLIAIFILMLVAVLFSLR